VCTPVSASRAVEVLQTFAAGAWFGSASLRVVDKQLDRGIPRPTLEKR
jgi:predicted thioesterase